MEKVKSESLDILNENIKKMKELFPEVFTEDKIDFQRLEEILGNYVEDSNEKYSFNWNGKGRALRISQIPSTGTLRPSKEDSKNWDTTKNLYIEGDNLEVLKLLQKTYHSKIKMIYIDPPYNTGKDFVYKDDYRDNIKNYLDYTGQTDEEGRKMGTNSETSGRYHTDWLNMMYPRLRLARNLLTDDGVIFISIDDNEVHNLRKICDEVFGEDNFVANIIWEKVHTRKNSARYFSESHDFIICISKNKDLFNRNLIPRENTSSYKNPDNDPKGPWKPDPIYANNPYDADYIIEKPNGVKLKRPTGRFWRYSKATIDNAIVENRIIWGNDSAYPMLKRYLSDVSDGIVPITIFSREFAGDNMLGNNEIKEIFQIEKIFSYPKPTKLVKRLIQLGTANDSIILDFFSGSSTTAHAVMQLNAEDNGNRKFIMVQLPEPTDETSEAYKAGYKNIAEIGKERIRRAGAKILEDNKDKEGIDNLDIGFKVFKLDKSNIKEWNPDYNNIQTTLEDMVENFVPGRTEEDILYEIILKYGIDITLPIEEHNIEGKKVFDIDMGALFICLDNDITLEVVEGIGRLKEQLDPEITRVVFKDNGFKDDSVKTNTILILKRYGIDEDEVKSI